jgi:signal peptidase I
MTTRRLGSGLLSTGRLLSIVALAISGGLLVWAVLPLALGWSAHAVVSGSMSPQVRIGDVLMSGPVPGGQLQPADPTRVLSHRIHEIAADGSLITQGDANPTPDPGSVPVANVIGVAKLRIPLIGLPAVWFGSARYDLVLLTLVGLSAAATLAAWPDPENDELEDGVAGPAVTEPWPWLVHMRTP